MEVPSIVRVDGRGGGKYIGNPFARMGIDGTRGLPDGDRGDHHLDKGALFMNCEHSDAKVSWGLVVGRIAARGSRWRWGNNKAPRGGDWGLPLLGAMSRQEMFAGALNPPLLHFSSMYPLHDPLSHQ